MGFQHQMVPLTEPGELMVHGELMVPGEPMEPGVLMEPGEQMEHGELMEHGVPTEHGELLELLEHGESSDLMTFLPWDGKRETEWKILRTLPLLGTCHPLGMTF